MKVTVKDIRAIKVGKPLITLLPNKKERYFTRNLVTYVNNVYPVDGYRYTTHITKENIVSIQLVKTDNHEPKNEQTGHCQTMRQDMDVAEGGREVPRHVERLA
jgi:hypothetical protein